MKNGSWIFWWLQMFFILLKITSVITWSWVVILFPTLFFVILSVFVMTVIVVNYLGEEC